VEDYGFRNLIQTIRPDLNIPSADTMVRFIKSEYELVFSEVKRNFAEIESKISLTLDCWTSSSMKCFLGVTAHWIDDWTIHECVLDFADISDISHTGANLANILGQIIEKSGIQRNILAIVADNARNNDTLFSNLQPVIEQIRCFGHVLNLVVQEALAHISETITSLRELVKKIRNSSQLLEKLMRICSSSNIPQVKPLLDVVTRWSSTYIMITRAIELRKVREYYWRKRERSYFFFF
jgi:hypothetical protein